MYKKSGNPKVEELTKSYRERSYNLSCLMPIKTDEINEKGKPVRMCAWCTEVRLTHGNQKYCCVDCSNSAMAWAYPQKEDSLRYLLIRQNFVCIHCMYNYRPFLEEMIKKDRFRRPHVVHEEEIEKLPWHYFKRLKSRVPKEYRPEVDHIIPVYKGGNTLGQENHQILCFSCHKAKSKIDNSGPRNK